jgi:hypothetical protein
MTEKYDLIIISDDQDTILGHYFNSCSEDLIFFLSVENISQISIKENINHVYIFSSFQRITNSVYVCYSHGNTEQLISNSSSYIDKDTVSSLKKTLFYTNACSCGANLGVQLVRDSKIDTFVGYNEEIDVVLEYKDYCIKCDNAALQQFLAHPNKTIKECVRISKQYYTQVIDKLLENNDPLAASCFVAAREALVLLGDEDLTYNSIRLK